MYNVVQLIQALSSKFKFSENELTKLWEEILTKVMLDKWEIEQEKQKDASSKKYHELKEDIIIRYGQELSPEKSKLAIFYVNSLIKPKHNKPYPSDTDDWEWRDTKLATDLKEYLKDDVYRLVLVSNEILSWKIELVMNVAHELLPENGKLTILIGVRNPFPLPNLFKSCYPSMKWKDGIVIGQDHLDTYLGHLVGINYNLSSSYSEEIKQ